MVRIAEVESGSQAEAIGLEIGSRVVRINGDRVRDNIDLTYLLADRELSVEVESPEGKLTLHQVVRQAGTPFGIVPVPDKVRECGNECVFCFIDGNPPDARGSLWLRDDDFRLSFTYGSYVTLTNVGPRGLARLVEQGISPLYVSVHATDPDVRERLLVNRRARMIMDQLRELGEGGVDVHAQVVLCPGWNDGPQLDRTIEDLWGLGPSVLSLSVVPVGLTRYNVNRPVRLLTAEEAAGAIDRVDATRERGYGERDRGWCYAADELYLIAKRELPAASYYDGWPLEENGVGATRRFLDGFDAGLGDLPSYRGRRIRLVTGSSMAPFLRNRVPRLADATAADIDVVEVRNRYFGETVTIAGLLPGADVSAALAGTNSTDLIVLPSDSLSDDGVFIDDVSLDSLRMELDGAEVVCGREVTEALRRSGQEG